MPAIPTHRGTRWKGRKGPLWPLSGLSLDSWRRFEMRIELGSLPDPDLNPNKRLHYMQTYTAKRNAKDLAMSLVRQQGRPSIPYKKAHISITWVAKDRRRRDPDNLFASRSEELV